MSTSSLPASAPPPRPGITVGFLGLAVLAVGLLALIVFGPGLIPAAASGVRLGTELPMHALKEPASGLTPDQVAQLPPSAFALVTDSFNVGYTPDVYWLRVQAPELPRSRAAHDLDPLWLEVLPPYLDQVTLYQRAGHVWRERTAGDLAPPTARVGVRQLLFPLIEGEPLLLRVKTTSPMQIDGTVWRNADLLAHFARNEWASGLYMGLNLTMALMIAGAALTLRKRALWAMTVAALATLAHGAADRGYLALLLPDTWSPWCDLAVKVGTLTLPAAMAWQAREIMTWGTDWRRTDLAFIAIGAAPLLCLPAIPLGTYADWAWVGISAPWMVCLLWSYVAWGNLLRQGPTLSNLLMAGPSTVTVLFGIYVMAIYLGWARLPQLEASMFWQFITSQMSLLVTLAVGASLIEKYRASASRQRKLVAQLRHSEQVLDERVRQRTAELLKAQNSLQLTLHSERQMREDQRHFFNMINHEFRTPLAVIDSGAAEQQSFPSPELDAQVARATQIRRACRRLTTLVDNCLISDRLDAEAFELHPRRIWISDLVEEATQMARWSRRHDLHLDLEQAPYAWVCDPMLLHIALSNLVDNAVKHGQPGRIDVQVQVSTAGQLELAVSDSGPRVPDEDAADLFELGRRGSRHTKGFGLGLWVTRRIARLHGGDVTLRDTGRGGNCFTLVLPPLACADEQAHQPGAGRAEPAEHPAIPLSI